MTPYIFPNPTVEEPKKQECSQCHSQYTKFVRYESDGINSVEVYVCHTCNTTFKIKAEEIPY